MSGPHRRAPSHEENYRDTMLKYFRESKPRSAPKAPEESWKSLQLLTPIYKKVRIVTKDNIPYNQSIEKTTESIVNDMFEKVPCHENVKGKPSDSTVFLIITDTDTKNPHETSYDATNQRNSDDRLMYKYLVEVISKLDSLEKIFERCRGVPIGQAEVFPGGDSQQDGVEPDPYQNSREKKEIRPIVIEVGTEFSEDKTDGKLINSAFGKGKSKILRSLSDDTYTICTPEDWKHKVQSFTERLKYQLALVMTERDLNSSVLVFEHSKEADYLRTTFETISNDEPIPDTTAEAPITVTVNGESVQADVHPSSCRGNQAEMLQQILKAVIRAIMSKQFRNPDVSRWEEKLVCLCLLLDELNVAIDEGLMPRAIEIFLDKKEEQKVTIVDEILKFEKYVDSKDFVQRLYLTSILKRDMECAIFLWMKLEGHIPGALLAAGYNYQRFQKQKDESDKEYEEQKDEDSYENDFQFFTHLAKQAINKCYDNNKALTVDFIGRKFVKWGNKSCYDLAVDSANRKILELEAVHDLSKRVWKEGEAWNKQIAAKEEKSKYKMLTNKLSTPKFKFYIDFLFNFLFLNIYGLMLMLWLDEKTLHITESLVLVWKVCNGISLHYLIAVSRNSFYKYPSKEFKIMGFITLVLYTLATLLRALALLPSSDSNLMPLSRLIYSYDFVVCTVEMLKYCYGSPNLGKVLAMMYSMTKDMVYVLIVVAAFFASFAVASRSVMNPQGTLNVWCIFRIAFWSTFGEMDYEEYYPGEPMCKNGSHIPFVERTSKYMMLLLYGIFVIIVNLMLVNLLIAKFNSSIEEIDKNSKKLWTNASIALAWTYSNNWHFPPPFTGLTFLKKILFTDKKNIFATNIPGKDKGEYDSIYFTFERDSLHTFFEDLKQEEILNKMNPATKWTVKIHEAYSNYLQKMFDEVDHLDSHENESMRLSRAPSVNTRPSRNSHYQKKDNTLVKGTLGLVPELGAEGPSLNRFSRILLRNKQKKK
ncbi:transient receptor potential cation channel subfamily M member 2-like [Physella acuta]|uniref:transient receptor potential cation channel subfamily M member 2-like n=1 Tax=Physella acuta TaxID=109671 RepID=UPI0027DB6111|nr:transient receptor potential cation channel subfamily M member 2-like [Physella acuta]